MRSATPMTRPLRISVVIPVKDDAGDLRHCLRALELQTRAPDEVIVVDNASVDDSADAARAAGARVVRCETPGIAAAASAGYNAATGDVIARLDADCLPAAGWIEAIARGFADRPDVAVRTGGARFVDGPRMLRAPLAAAYLGAYTLVGVLALGHLPLFGSHVAFRRSVWERVRTATHRDAALHDDLDLAFHVGEHVRIRPLIGAGMGMSMRPFASPRMFGRRMARGVRTVVIHWPHDFPPLRWNRILLRAALRRRRRR